MDNLCHTLTGVALARAGCDRLSTYALPTLVVASNLPDADIVAWYWGDLAYLVHHRGITHSYVGIVGQTIALAGIMTGIGRLLASRHEESRRPSFLGLLAVSFVGLAAHLLLDYTNAYGIRPNLPFEDRWVYGDLVFIVDPWLWLVFGGALYAGSRRTRAIDVGNLALFALLTALIVAVTRSSATGVELAGWVWGMGLCGVLAARRVSEPRHGPALARAALGAMALYWGALAVLSASALERVRDHHAPARPEAGAEVAALPMPLYPSRWRVMVETTDVIREFEVTVIGTASVVEVAFHERNLDNDYARAALGTCAGRVAAWFNRHLVAEVIPNGDGSSTVNLRDVRFPARSGPGIANTVVALDPSLRPLDDRRTCPE